jgi:homoaconitase/3-isopropylmalate dehydratase large subunit
MRITVERKLYSSIEVKDLMLYIIETIEFTSAMRYIIEYASLTIQNMSIEIRITICNISIKASRRARLITSNDMIFAYIKERLFTPREY